MMIPQKSYCFLRCCSEHDANEIYRNLHGQATIGQNNTVIYLSRVLQLPYIEYDNPYIIWIYPEYNKSWPCGLHVIEDFITSDE